MSKSKPKTPSCIQIPSQPPKASPNTETPASHPTFSPKPIPTLSPQFKNF